MYKILSILFISIILLYHPFIAQNKALGIYLSANDFMKNKLSYSTFKNQNCIHIHELIYQGFITIKTHKQKLKLSKDSVFGFKDKSGQLYRFYKNSTYAILNPIDSIVFYSQTRLGGLKHNQPETHYYFSSHINSPIIELSLNNIKREFKNDTLFYDAITVQFKDNESLLNYDTIKQQYQINYIYNQYINYENKK